MDWDGWDEDEMIEGDEQMMTDLHLGNALNLDRIEYVVNRSFTDYRIFIPWYVRKHNNIIRKKIKIFESTEIGFLLPTQQFLTTESRRCQLSYTLYKKLLRVIGDALMKREVQIPLTGCYQQLIDYEVTVKELYMVLFRFFLQIACSVSEASRGGRSPVYKGIEIDEGCAYTEFSFMGFDWQIAATNSICALSDMKRDITYFGNFDSILLMMDTLGQRLCLDIGNQIAKRGRVSGTLNIEVVDVIIHLLDTVLERYENPGYEFIGMFEAIVVSAILKKNPDRVTDADEFLMNNRSEVVEMVKEGLFEEDIIVVFDKLIQLLLILPNDALSNLFCVYRIWGHPRVNIVEGMKKAMTKGTEKKEICEQTSEIVLLQFRKMFIEQYYVRHHKYPICLNLSEVESYIWECISTDVPISTTNSRYCFSDYRNIEIQHLWELPETYDVCHILNDKAVTPNRSELIESIRKNCGTVEGAQRRGLVRWLLSDSIRCKAFLKDIDQNGLDDESLIIGMYEKEREIKVKARMYSLMSEKMRMYTVLTEQMISERIFKYFPQITMTDPLHVQTKKLWNISGTSTEECLDPVINIDFEKWNLNMREEFTLPLFQQLDRLFGFRNLISRTHEFFRRSYVYASSGTYLPKINDGRLCSEPPMAYEGHDGGFEGLRQKGWTLATVCLLSYIADSLHTKINLLGQGDNQVVRIYMPKSYWDNINFADEKRVNYAKNLLADYILQMETLFSRAGLPIKSRETWKSTRLFMYGKIMFIDGNLLPQWMKKLLRSYAMSNEGTLTTSGVIGTIATNLCSAAQSCDKPDIMYALFLLLGEWSLDFLFVYHPFTRQSIRERDVIKFIIPSRGENKVHSSGPLHLRWLKAVLLTVPTAVGGSVTIPLTGFIMRGFPDNASEGYSWIKLLGSVESDFQDLYKCWYTFLCNETTEYDMLIQSPWSLNHKKPPTPGLQSRDMVRDWLLKGEFDANHFMYYLRSSMSGFERKEICQFLINNEVNPLILHELYNTFPQSYLDQILRRIENTRTIKKLALKTKLRKPIIKKMMRIEHEFIGYLFWRCSKRGEVFSDCATKHCREARNTGWNLKIKGLTTPHPLEFLFDSVCSRSLICCSETDHIYARIDQRANFPPYLGSSVKTKVVSLQDIALRTEPLVSTSAKLLRFATWLNLGENTLDLIRANIKTVCDVDIFEHVDDIEETFFSGSVEHRFNPSTASEGCFINYAPQVGSRVFLSSDSMPKFGRGNANFTIHFQAMYCFCQYEAAYSVGSKFKHYHICCEDCVVPVDDSVDDIQDMSFALERLYTDERIEMIRNALGYLDKKVMEPAASIENQQHNLKMIDGDMVDATRLKEGVHRLLALRSAMQMMYTRREIPDSVDLDDLQYFPRIYAYKVSTVRILRLTAEFLLIIKISRSPTCPNLNQFLFIKNKLINQLKKLPLEKFRGIGSLCLGRSWETVADEEDPMLNVGDFPDDTASFLNSVRNEVLETLSLIMPFSSKRAYVQIPALGITRKESMFLIFHSLIMENKCEACSNIMWHKLKEKEYMTDCPDSHYRQSKKKVIGIRMPLDAAVKTMSVLIMRKYPQPVVNYNKMLREVVFRICGEISMPNIVEAASLHECSERLQSQYQIRIPCSSIYKWEFFLSKVSPSEIENVIIFGDASGCLSLIASRRFYRSTVFPTTFLGKKRFIPQDMTSWRPPLSRYYKNVSYKLLETVPDDVSDKHWSDAFSEFLFLLEGKCLIISNLLTDDGSLNVIQKIHAVLEKHEADYLQIHLILGTEIDCEVQGFSRYITPFNDIKKTECFLCSMQITADRVKSGKIFSGDFWHELSRSKIIHEVVESIERAYPECLQMSLKISKSLLYRNFVTAERSFFAKPACVTLYEHLLYVSANFKAPSEQREVGDNRLMLYSILGRVVRGIKMILLIIFGEDISEQEYFDKLTIKKVQKSRRPQEVKNLQAILASGSVNFKLTHQEIEASRQLKIMRDNLRKTLQVSVPSTLVDLYKDYIVVGKKYSGKI